MKKIITAVVAIGLALASVTPAMAAGSDSATPYSVTTSGITLPSGTTFEANGHVNIRISTPTGERQQNTHFDPNNNQPGGAYIGKDFLPVNLAAGECIVWVQVSLYNQHFGEGGQAPVCAPVVVVEPPVVVPPVVLPPVDTKETKVMSWLIPKNINPNTAHELEIWPQTVYTTEVCGTSWIQVDTYRYGTADEKARVDALDDDGLLKYREDAGLYISHQFIQQKPCPVIDTTPTTITAPTLTVLPPTCEADGTLPFLGNPAAQNPNGYEFPGQGYRVYLNKAFTGAGTYEATIQKVGPGFDAAFPYGTKLTGTTKQTLVVAAATGFQSTDSEAPCYVAPPVEPPVIVEPPVVTPPVVVPPVVEEPVTESAEPAVDKLAYTGTGGAENLLFFALVLALLGAVAIVAVNRKKPRV